MDQILLETLLWQPEGPALDFKRQLYPFVKASDDEKSKLLKDVLSLTNSWRNSTAYILIGVEEVKGGRSKVVGITEQLDDAALQEFVNSKTHGTVDFTYYGFASCEGTIGVVEIPVQERPVFLQKPFGKLKADVVYTRSGSSNVIARLDESLKMYAQSNITSDPVLSLEWVDPDSRVALPSPLPTRKLVLHPWLPVEKLERPPSNSVFDIGSGPRWNQNYRGEIIQYSAIMALFQPLGLKLTNLSGVAAKRVRLIASISRSGESQVMVRLEPLLRPERKTADVMDLNIVSAKIPTDEVFACFRGYDRQSEITVDFGDLRPHEAVYTTQPMFIGSKDSQTVQLEGRLLADNLPTPIECFLQVDFEVGSRPMCMGDLWPHWG
jgi:hypothetical protein